MSVVEWVMVLLFGVPLAAACVVFMLCAMWMQMREDQRSAQKHGLAESV